jgi:hypothetical protein
MNQNHPIVRAWLAGQYRVIARRPIEPSPLSAAPVIPAGRRGEIQDFADDLLWVDFGGRWGTVAVEPWELR